MVVHWNILSLLVESFVNGPDVCKLWGRHRQNDIETLMLDDKSHGFFTCQQFFLLLTTFEKDSKHAWIMFEANIG